MRVVSTKENKCESHYLLQIFQVESSSVSFHLTLSGSYVLCPLGLMYIIHPLLRPSTCPEHYNF